MSNVTDLYSSNPEVKAAAQANNPGSSIVKNEPVLTTPAPVEPVSTPAVEAASQEVAPVDEFPGLTQEEATALKQYREKQENVELSEKIKKYESMSKEDIIKEWLSTRTEAAARRIQTKEVKQEKELMSSMYDQKFSEFTKKLEAFQEKAMAYDEMMKKQQDIEKAAMEAKLTAEERIQRKEAEVKDYEAKLKEYEKTVQEMEGKYNSQLEAERKKAEIYEIEKQAQQLVYKEKVDKLMEEVSVEKRRFAEQYIAGANGNWEKAHAMMLDAKLANLFGQKTIHVTNDTPNRNSISQAEASAQNNSQSANPYAVGHAMINGQLTPVLSGNRDRHSNDRMSRSKISSGLNTMRQSGKNKI